MKTTLSAILFLSVVMIACNGNSKKNPDTKSAAKDAVSASLVVLTAASSMPQLLCQNWEDKEDIDDGVLNGNSSGGDLDIPFRSYHFFEDGQVVQSPRDNMKTGKWVLDEKTKHISIVFTDGSKKDLQLKAIGVKNLLLQNGKEPAIKFVADGRKQKDVADEPFYPANNKWRIKPLHSETDDAIKERVIGCVNFYSKFFKDNADRKAATISFYGLPSCFKWYSGGISIINKEKVGTKWINCFYNKDQAVQGQQLLENIISKKYNWNRQEPQWVRQSADVLRQMADSLK